MSLHARFAPRDIAGKTESGTAESNFDLALLLLSHKTKIRYFRSNKSNPTKTIMVIKANNRSSITHVDADAEATISTTIDAKAPENEMSDKIAAIKAYFATLDGKPDSFGRFEKEFQKTVHPKVVLESDQHPDMRYDDLVHLVKTHFIPKGCVSELMEVIDNGDGTLTSVVNNHLPGEDGDITYQRAYFNDDDQVIKVVTTSSFGDMVGRVEALAEEKYESFSNVEDVVELYRQFLGTFDGSSGSNVAHQELFNQLFADDFVLVTEDGIKDREFFRNYVGSVADEGEKVCSSTVKALSDDKVLLDFYVGKSVHFVRVHNIATIGEGGKVTRSEPAIIKEDAFRSIYESLEKKILE